MSGFSRQDERFDMPNAPAFPVAMRWIDTEPVRIMEKPCAIESLDLQIRVCGLYADVTETLVIGNPNKRDLSVDVAIPMPDRAVVCGYSLEIDGQMIDGVVVPKEKARVAFEAEQRRGADPGLVEAVKGNVYRTRVYPVAARSARTIQLRYVAPLLVVGGTSAFLDAPMPADWVGKRSIRIDVELLDCPAPVLSGVNGPQFKEVGTCWRVESDEHDVAPNSGVRVALPQLPASFALVERDETGEMRFVASEAAVQADHGNDETPAVSSLTVLWDVSGSRADVDHEAELELLRGYCAGIAAKPYRLIAFGSQAGQASTFEDADELLDCVRQLNYDGGSDFQELSRALAEDAATGAGRGAGAVYVLFTDGMDTLSGEAVSFPPECKVLAVVSGAQRDTESLRQACGGLAFDLAAAPQGGDGLARALYCNSLLSGIVGEGVAEVLGIGSGSDGRHTIVGRLVSDSTSVSFVNSGTEFSLDAARVREGNTLARAWAAVRVAQLSPRSDENADELLALGRRFGVVSPATSLLVLESIDQWLRYDIEPPVTWETMHREWERSRPGVMRVSSEEERAAQHLDDLKRAWADLRQWWNRDFSAASSVAGGPSFCRACGAPVEPDSRFCRNCGARLSSAHPIDDALLGGVAGTYGAAPDAGGSASAFPSLAGLQPQGADGRGAEPLPRMQATSSPLSRIAAAASSMRDAFAPDARIATRECADVDEGALPDAAFGDAGVGSFASMAAEPVDDGGGDQIEAADGSAAASVKVQAWMPDAAYLKALDAALPDGVETVHRAYFQQRAQYAASPSFFIDCAGWFMAHDDLAFGLRVLTNLAELRIEDAALLRVMAWRLREAGDLARALVVLRRVLKLRPEDSQSHRDLALVLDELARRTFGEGDAHAAKKLAEEAGAFYRKIALTPWQRRAQAIGLFAVEEYNVMRAWADAQTWKDAPQLEPIDDGLEGVFDCDLRITMAWDADETDVDLHVTEPTGEEAYYGNRLTHIGGRVSEDITDGYGPELYEIRHAKDGEYAIRAHYFASHQQTVFGPATCTLTVYTDWGRPTQRQQITSTRLENAKEMVDVGTAVYGGVAAVEGDGESEHEPASPVAKGSSVADLIAAYGQPAVGDASLPDTQLIWELPAGRTRVATIADGVVARIVERMPWGEELVVV